MNVSIIVAVYNGGNDVNELVESLLGQTMPREEFEVIFVDDDSTDDTLATLTAVADAHPHITVLHNTPNSGWPGRPRNMALGIAQGDYVFFADHDDYLPADSLQTMYDFAVEHGTDVLLAKEVGVGQTIPWQTFRKTVPQARLGVDPLLRILTPHKLIRRALLDDNDIRFPEGDVRLEDHQVVMRAYFAADVISIYADSPCYYWVRRKGTNISGRPVDPRSYFRDVEKVLQIVEDHTEPGDLRNELYLHWYQRRMLRAVGRPSLLRLTPDQQQGLIDTIGPIITARIDPDLDLRLPYTDRVRAHLVRAGRLDRLIELMELDTGVTAKVGSTRVRWESDTLQVEARAELCDRDGEPLRFDRVGERVRRRRPAWIGDEFPAGLRDLATTDAKVAGTFVLRDRASGEVAEIATTREGGFLPGDDGASLVIGATARASIDARTAFRGRPLPDAVDVSLRFSALGWAAERRVPFDHYAPAKLGHDIDGEQVVAYATKDRELFSIRRGSGVRRGKGAHSDVPASARLRAAAGRARPRAEEAARQARRLGRRAAQRWRQRGSDDT